MPARLRVRRDEQTVLAGITDASKRFAMRLEAREAREFAGHEWALEALRTMRHNRVDYPREMEAWAVASTAHTGARPLPRPVPMASPNRLVLW